MRSTALPTAVLRRGLLAGAAVTATLVLSACGGDSSSSGTGMDHGGMTATSAAPAASAPSASATFNDADVTFGQSMIPHHQQAIEMAAMADGRASDAKVKELAAKVKAAQQPEIDTMNQWLTAWGKPAAMPGMSSDAHGTGHESMPGMMSDADMDKLMDAKGAAFDKQFLTMMIAHHEGAIEMAKQETAQGSSPEAKTLAEKIITDQQAEITTMKGILGQR
ncbi:DUF305 domain-containing protein [Couchioplanes caeruleus subsp. caeruleus]|uniref:DUF305 domain-containing protein n=2 Tax=Couchioplanes caeruleus TaxID=56438 RepID=A0A1K0GJP4_9ACTN|nr:DUF305 domain-containing protein [Couchioplanes caeruleus subsp. caeruleus]